MMRLGPLDDVGAREAMSTDRVDQSRSAKAAKK
jgi:hypothetical protein